MVGNVPGAIGDGWDLALTVGGSHSGKGGTVQTDPAGAPLIDIATTGDGGRCRAPCRPRW